MINQVIHVLVTTELPSVIATYFCSLTPATSLTRLFCGTVAMPFIGVKFCCDELNGLVVTVSFLNMLTRLVHNQRTYGTGKSMFDPPRSRGGSSAFSALYNTNLISVFTHILSEPSTTLYFWWIIRGIRDNVTCAKQQGVEHTIQNQNVGTVVGHACLF
jgi:hypothetical protein